MMAFSGYRPWFLSVQFRTLVRILWIVSGCIAATALLARPAFSAALAADAPPVQVFHVPVPEDQALNIFQTIYPGPVPCADDNNDPRSENPVTTYISISVLSHGTLIYYDHWEDGFEIDISNPVQATTEIWGDGDLGNGVAPGTVDDLITVNTVIVLDNQVDVTTRDALPPDYDGGDRIGATRTIAVTRAVWASATNTLLADALEVYPVDEWGTHYEAPAGVDVTYNNLFEYSGLSIMAAQDDTQIGVDTDDNGTTDVLQTLNTGESYLVNGGVQSGAMVTATAPIQVVFITGDICADYESRWYALFPRDRWSDSYYSPVGTPLGNGTNVFVYNPATTPISVSWEIASGPQTPLNVPGRSTARALIPEASGSHFFTTDGSQFAAFVAVDSDDGPAQSANSAFDWGFAMVPQSQLTPQTLIGWGAGRDPTSNINPNENGSPVWVMPVFTNGGAEPVRICADFDGDRAGSLTDALGYQYDVHFLLNEFEVAKIYEPGPPDGDGDQTGMVVYVCDPDPNEPSHALLVAAWGEEPGVASNQSPGLDLGTTAPPAATFEAGKAAEVLLDADEDNLASPGDTLLYTIVIRNSSRVPIANVTLSDTVPLHTAYVMSTTTFDDGSGVGPIADDGSGTPFPLDEGGVSLGALDIDGIFTVTFQVTVDDPFPPFVDRVRNVAIVRANGEERRPEVETPIDKDPQIDLEKHTNGVDADTPTGPLLAVGAQVTWTYILTNSDIVSVTSVVVSDSVPGVTPTFVGGDTGNDGILAPGETWVYTATGIAAAGQYSNTGTATATATGIEPDADPAFDADDSHYFGVDSGIDITKTPTATEVIAGLPVTYTFAVSNIGNSPLASVAVTDDHCAPVNAVLSGGFNVGDTNGDDLLDVGELWSFACSRVLTQTVTNTATVEALDLLSRTVTASDTATVDVVSPGIGLVKQPSRTAAFSGTLIVYTYTVSNLGPSELSEVTLTDDRCSPLNFQGVDSDGDERLDLDEIWLYTCSITLTADITNTAVVTAIDPGGRPVSATDFAVVRIPFLYLPIIRTLPAEPEPPAPCPPPNGCPIGAQVKALAVNESTNRLYVVTRNPSALLLIDPQTNATLATGTTGAEPWGVAVDEDRNRVYVSDYASHDVRVYDGSTLASVGAPIELGDGTRPAFIEVLPATGDDEVFVVLNGTGRVAVIQGLQRLYDTDAGGAGSFGLAVARNLQHIYVSHRDARKMTVLTRQSGQWTLLHPGPETGSKEPFELAYSETASRLFLVNHDSPTWYVDMWKVNAGSDWSFITRQDVPSGGNPASADVGGAGLEVSRTTGKIYNLNTGADNLSILNVSGDSLFIAQTLALGDDPFAIAINNTTQTVFIGLRAPGRLVKIADQP